MRRDSITTLKDLDQRGHDVRAWCFTCARGARIQIYYVRRYAALTLSAAAQHFRCLLCDSAAAVALFPATRPHKMPSAAATPARDPARAMTSADLVAAIYFGARAAAKKARADAGADRASEQLRAALQAKKNAPKRVPTKPVKLRLIGTPNKK